DRGVMPGSRTAMPPAPSDHPKSKHRFGDAQEAEDVRARDVVARTAEFFRGLVAVAMDLLHDLLEPLLRVLERPRVAARILLHLERGRRNPARVRGLAGAVGDARFAQNPNAARR